MAIFTWNDRPGPSDPFEDGGTDRMFTRLTQGNHGSKCDDCGRFLKNGDKAMCWDFGETWLLLHAECAAAVSRGMIQDLAKCIPNICKPRFEK